MWRTLVGTRVLPLIVLEWPFLKHLSLYCQPVVSSSHTLTFVRLNLYIYMSSHYTLHTHHTTHPLHSAPLTPHTSHTSYTLHTAFPLFDVYPLPMWVGEGSTLVLDCQATSVPPPTISWLQDFEPVNVTAMDCSNLEVTSDPVVCLNGSLIVVEVDFSATGFYTCVADNGVDSVNQVSVSVDVVPATNLTGTHTHTLHSTHTHTFILTMSLSHSTHIPPHTGPVSSPLLTSSPPIFKPRLTGDNLTLPCSAEGNPQPTITWLRDNSPLNFLASDNIVQVSVTESSHFVGWSPNH